MDPFLIGSIGLGLYLFFKGKKAAASASDSTPGVTPETPETPDAPDTHPPGPFDPFDPPDDGSGARDDDASPSPVPVPSDTAPEDIGPYTLAITQDCQQVFEGEQWFDSVFLPASKRLVEREGDAFHHPWILMRTLLLHMSGGTLEPACIREWTYFKGVSRDYPGGPWDSETNAGYEAFAAYSDWYDENYPAVDAFLLSLDERLWDSSLASHFNQYDDAIVFVQPSAVA